MEEDPLNSIATCKWGRFKSDLTDAEIYNDFPSYKDFDNPLHLINALGYSLGFFPINAYLIKRSIVNKAGYWNEYLSLNDDAEFMLRVISNSERICFVPTALAFYRLPEKDNLSSYTDEGKVKDAINSWKLIEAYLRIRFKKEEYYFLEKAIHEFYHHAKVFPDVISNNKEFFRVPLRRDSSRLRNFFLRIKGE
jgi:GT2 family glycosyltransferase